MATEPISGEPGTTWHNDTEKVRYQFIAALVNTCGACLQWHMQIGPYWPIQLHFGCHCQQIAIRPGGNAPNPFVDFREILDNMSYADQKAAIGASNYALLEAGVVKWDEVVTRYRVRTLREVIAINKVSFKTAVKAGVPKQAYQAWGDVYSTAAEAVRAERKRLLETLKMPGISQDALVDALSRGIVSKTRLVAPGVDQSLAPYVARIPGGDRLAKELAAIAALHPVYVRGQTVVSVVVAPDRVTVTDDVGRVQVVGPGGSAFGRSYEELRRLGTGRRRI